MINSLRRVKNAHSLLTILRRHPSPSSILRISSISSSSRFRMFSSQAPVSKEDLLAELRSGEKLEVHESAGLTREERVDELRRKNL